MSQSMFDWFPLPAIRKATDAPRRVLADVLGFPATPIYATDDAPTEEAAAPRLALPAPKKRTPEPRKKRRRRKKTRRRSR